MSSERAKILKMVAEGTITPEEGEKLMSRLDPTTTTTDLVDAGHGSGGEHRGPLKFLRVVVDSSDGDKVNIRVPMALVRTGLMLSTMIPVAASEELKAAAKKATNLRKSLLTKRVNKMLQQIRRGFRRPRIRR